MFTETHPWQPLYRLWEVNTKTGQARVLNYKGTAGQSRVQVCVQHKYPMLPAEAGDISEKVTFELGHERIESRKKRTWARGRLAVLSENVKDQ